MHKNLYKNLNFLTIRFPFTSIISILHRISGIFVFLFIPFLLWTLSAALSSNAGFDKIHHLFIKPEILFLTWLILLALWYHLFAGIRHLLMDSGLGESLIMARISGMIVLVLTLVFAILTGIRLW